MSANLNEFTGAQLTALISLCREKMDDLSGKMDIVSTFKESNTKTQLMQICIDDFDTFQLWAVQLENAREEVVKKEIITLN